MARTPDAPPWPLPPYAFVPGHFPHPVRDPNGHHFGIRTNFGKPPSPLDWSVHPGYHAVLELLYRGFYWEAHEGLEDFWHQCTPEEWRRPFFQGLLHLAAAGVKVRQGQPGGVHSHASKAAARLEQACALAASVDLPSQTLLGLPMEPLTKAAHHIGLKAHVLKAQHPLLLVEAVLPLPPLPETLWIERS